MKIKMLRSVPGSVNGIDVEMFKTGRVYDSDRLGESLVNVFLDNKFAIMAPEEVELETKSASPVTENKMIDPVEEDKSKFGPVDASDVVINVDSDEESKNDKPKKKIKVKKKDAE